MVGIMDNQPAPIPPPPPAPRRRRGCLRWFIVALLIVLAVAVFKGGTFPSRLSIPVFGKSVGVVHIEGPINESAHIVKVIRGFRENPLVRAIVLRIDTPGGAVGASEEIFREVVKARVADRKVVIVSMGNAAASGGYYIASASQEIFANAGTITGSIGVIALDWNVQEILRRAGVESVVLKSGEHKDSGSPFRKMGTEDRRLIQGVIFDSYRQFFREVLRARHKEIATAIQTRRTRVEEILSTATTKGAGAGIEWDAFTTGSVAAELGVPVETETALRWMADGRVFTGEQAQALGLVDRIGTLGDAIERAGELSGLGKKPPVVERQPESAIPLLLGLSARQFWQEFSRGSASYEFRTFGD